jgi:fibronectin type 3 domain-containing protein
LYTITYEPVESAGRVSRQAQTVQTEQTSTTVGGLLSEAEYLVHITVSTDGGSSAASEPVTVPMIEPPPPSGPNTSTESPTSVGVAVAMVMVVVIIVVGAIALAVSGVIFVVHIRKRSTHSSSDVEYAVDDSHINMQENPAYATVSCSAQTSPSAPNYENVQ